MYKSLIVIGALLLGCNLFSQDTLSGIYDKLKIEKGFYIIEENTTVKESLIIESGANIEIRNNSALIIEGEFKCIGLNEKIKFFGENENEGSGIIIKSIANNNSIIIENVIFSNLGLPLFFDYGWKRAKILIQNNIFSKNTGKSAIIQILSPPFDFNDSNEAIIFELSHNLFYGNKAPIYFEDFTNAQIKYIVSENAFIENSLFGNINYSLSSNMIYGRADNDNNNYLIEKNSFINNYLFDSKSDTIIQRANFGIYGSKEDFSLKNNFFDQLSTDSINLSIHDQKENYTSPLVEISPFLKVPLRETYTHVYEIKNESNEKISDTLKLNDEFSGFIIKSNNKINLDNLKLKLFYFSDTGKVSNSLLNFDTENLSDNEYKINIISKLSIGEYKYIEFFDIRDELNNDIGNYRIGYQIFLKNIYIHELKSKESLIEKNNFERNENIISPKMFFEKIDMTFKERLEGVFLSGGTIFKGSVSNSNVFSNDLNAQIALQLGYVLFRNLSSSISISSFKLSNSDLNSSNNDQLERGFSFSTNIFSLSPEINYDFFDNRVFSKFTRFRPSIGFGIDIISFNPKGVYKNEEFDLQPLGTGGQLLTEGGKPYPLLTTGYFLSGKFKYQWSRLNSVGFYFSFHNTFSDYIDDVGPDVYPDSKILLNEFGAEAAYFSNPTGNIKSGAIRSFPNDGSDSFLSFGVFFSRKLFKSKNLMN